MIVVFGSINIDLVTRLQRIPAPGETVLGKSYDVIPGGKGANQALAAARAGAEVVMIGAVGRDGFAETALTLLREAEVDLASVRAADRPTGAAFISVDAEGRNAIVVASGANAAPRADWISEAVWARTSTLLLQREAPEEATRIVAREAKSRGVRVIMNAAPADDFDPAILSEIDTLIVNEHEAAIVARSLGWSDKEPSEIARRLDREKSVGTIATLGAEGVFASLRSEEIKVLAPRVSVVDTTAAGDSFCGAFAAALDRGADASAALRFAVAAGSLACTKTGAQTSVPFRADIERLADSVNAR
ncbi:ribokinase [Terrarubrum flagellatum]|uniref:ribokinase n=1 Tax=Terrirubrum flagellatum TaxID=2895980 RepID=UPI0031450BC3